MGAYTFDAVAANNTTIAGIAAAGGSPTGNFDDICRVMAATFKQLVLDLGGAVTVGGTADAITIQMNDVGTFSAYFTGMVFRFKAGATNTGATTANVESLGVKKVRKLVAGVETALAAGDIVEDGLYGLCYDAALDSAAGAFILIDYNHTALPISGTAAQYDTALSDDNFLFESDLGQQTIWVPASAMTRRTTNGAAFGSMEMATNDVMVPYLAFDATTSEGAQILVQMPKGWNEGTIVAQFVWTHPATTTNFGVTWGIRAVALANDDALDSAFGTAVEVSDTGGTTSDVYISAETAAMTVAGSPGAEELVCFEFYRDPGDASDTMAVDAYLIGVKLHYTQNALSDS